jgi:glycosyltransferase involved in cell wall biosynthesis
MVEQLVSIVMPTYNSASLLVRALQSVVDQTYRNWEAIVIDNYSTDDTEQVVASFCDSRIKFFKTNNNGIIAVSRNLGIREAKGKWIAFLDADDWWLPNKLESSVYALEQGADIVYHDLLRAGPRQGWLTRHVIRSRILHPPIYDDLSKNGNGLLNSSVVVRRDYLVEIGGLSENPRLLAAEDFECWLRLARRTNRFHRQPSALGYYWIGDTNTSSSSRTLTCLGELREKYIKDSPPWLTFALAKANYDLGHYSEARSELALIAFAGTQWLVRLKTVLLKWMLIFK